MLSNWLRKRKNPKWKEAASHTKSSEGIVLSLAVSCPLTYKGREI